MPLLLFAAALLLRVWGIGWALPDRDRLFSYHPDESVVVAASLGVNPFLLLLDPQFYNYGSLSLLLNGGMIFLGKALGLVAAEPLPGVPSAGALLAARMVTAFLGAGTAVLLYHTGRYLYGVRAGVWAGILYALAPLAVQHGHFATVDVPATFWITGSLLFAARYLTSPTHTRARRDLFLAGLAAGLAAATKYNAGLVLLCAVAACLLAQRGERSAAKLLGAGGGLLVGGAAAGFLVGCPGILLNTSALMAGIAYESQHVRAGHGLVFVNTAPGFLYHVTTSLWWGLGGPLTVLTLLGVAMSIYRRRPGDLVLLVFVIPYYLLIGVVQVKFARYTLPLFPPLLLWIGALLPETAGVRAVRIGQIMMGGAATYGLLLTAGLNTVMTRTDPRDLAATYLRQSGVATVGVASGPWFWSPPLNPYTTAPNPKAAQKATMEATTPPRYLPAGKMVPVVVDGVERMTFQSYQWNVSALEADPPDAVTLSEFEYADAERIQDKDALTYLRTLYAAYPNRKVFSSPVQVGRVPFTKLDQSNGRLPTQHLPHDMLYTNPTTVVFTQ